MNKALGSSCTSCWKRPQHKAGAFASFSRALSTTAQDYTSEEIHQGWAPGHPCVALCCCRACANSPTLEEHWQWDAGRAGEKELEEHMQQDSMFQRGVLCLVIIWCPPLSEGDWFAAYPTTRCLHLHCLHHGNCVTVQGCMDILFQRTWACKTLLPFRPGLVRLCPAGRHRESVIPVVWKDFMWEGRGSWWVKFGHSFWYTLWEMVEKLGEKQQEYGAIWLWEEEICI